MILRSIQGAKGLFLPFETCTNFSNSCLSYCYQRAELYPTKEEKIKILSSLLNETSKATANNLFNELNEDILHWFVSGDCWSSAVTFFWDVVYRLAKMGCRQLGFTRNRKLWEAVPDIFILSLDSEDQLKQFDDRLDFIDQERIETHNVRVATPNNPIFGVDTGVKIYKLDIIMKNVTIKCDGGCGSDYYSEVESEFGKSNFLSKNLKNCSVCADKSKGCFKRKLFKINKPYYRDSIVTLDNLPKAIQPYMIGNDLDLF